MTSWPRSTRRVSPAEVARRDQRGDLMVLVALRRSLVRVTAPTTTRLSSSSTRSRLKMISVGQHWGNSRPEKTHRLPNVSNARSPVNLRAPTTTNHRQRPSARPVTAEVAGSSPVGVAIWGRVPRSGVGSSAKVARQQSLPRKTDGPDTAGERCRAPWERRAGQPATRRYPPARQSGAGVAGSRRRLGRLGRRTIGRRSGTTGGRRGRTTRGRRRSAAWR